MEQKNMRIYTFQPRDVLEEVLRDGRSYVDLKKTNLLHKMRMGADLTGPYFWMANKLSEKTGIWYNDVHSGTDDTYRELFGEVFETGNMPLLPYWGWYIVNGKNEKPGSDYDFGDADTQPMFNWTKNGGTMLLGLDIPEELVLLSDANAWYCVLQARPCYEYEDEETEAKLLKQFEEKLAHITQLKKDEDIYREMRCLFCETEKTWNNIFRLEGRRLRPIFPGGMEVYDVQAVFPYIDKEWLVDM